MPVDCPLDAEKLESIAQEFGTPYQLYDENLIRQNAINLINTFKSEFPSFKQFFAVKALPNPVILKVGFIFYFENSNFNLCQILVDEGCGLDCSSVGELFIAKEIGVPNENIVYTSNYTSKADLAAAYDQGVIINLDGK